MDMSTDSSKKVLPSKGDTESMFKIFLELPWRKQ